MICVVLTTKDEGPKVCMRCSDLDATECLGELLANVLEGASEGCVHLEVTESRSSRVSHHTE